MIILIEKNLLGRKKSKVTALEYFRSDAISIQVYYKILTNHYSDKITNFEQLYKEMTYGSRQTIKTILDFAVTSKFLIIGQNKNDKRYINMSDDYDRSRAFKTACDLIFKGKEQPSGYTEPLLHLNRLKRKINQN